MEALKIDHEEMEKLKRQRKQAQENLSFARARLEMIDRMIEDLKKPAMDVRIFEPQDE
jgi:hypothetical protein